MTLEETKNLLRKYHDIPQMIAEDLATIRHCEQQKNQIVLPSVNLSGIPTGSGRPSEQTARGYEREIKACMPGLPNCAGKKIW